MEPLRFLLVGGGKMGEAILSGLLRPAGDGECTYEAADFVVVNPGQDRRDYLSSRYGVTCVADVSQAPRASTVILAVKPQVMFDVLDAIRGLGAFQGGAAGPLFVSIAAGLTTDSLISALPPGAPVVRAMPNTPLSVGEGATGVCGSSTASPQQVEFVRGLFARLGDAVTVDEELMDVVGALSGSGPAYVAAMIEALTKAATAQGLDPDLSERLALQTVLGTALQIQRTGVTPEQARIAVCSPGGTTLAALAAMDDRGFDDVFAAGIEAAIKRSKELSQCTQ